MSPATTRRSRHSARRVFKPEPLESRTLLSAWGTVNDYNAGSAPTVGPMTSDTSGNVYACAKVVVGNNGYGVVLEKPSGSSTWNTIENAAGVSAFNAIAVDNAGDVYVAGSAVTSGSTAHWTVLERPAGSNTFSAVDSVVDTLANQCTGLAIDSAGNVYAAGQTNATTTTGKGKNATTTTTDYWTVRKQTGGQGAFTTVFNVVNTSSGGLVFGAISAINSGPTAGLYDFGRGGSAGTEWKVSKSIDGGATWSLLDDFQYAAGNVSGASGLSGDTAGNLFVVGGGTSATGHHWLVRESTNGGASWATIDDYQLNAGSYAAAGGVGVDLAGNVYVVGSASDGTNYHAIVRTNTGGSWTTADDFQYTAGLHTNGFSFAADSSGNLYTDDMGQDSSGAWHWVVRSAAGPTGPATASAATAASVFSSAQISGSGDPTDLVLHRKHRHG
jgi:hypothetical protein